MKPLTKSKKFFLALTLCCGILLGIVLLNLDFSAKHAYAADVESYSIEDDLSFSLFNNGTEYKVSARNRQLTSVVIPNFYNGLPVTEIADNGFTNCANLVSIEMHEKIKRIGNNAFTNCKNLEAVIGMPRVEHIGNNAFMRCPKLDDLIIPKSVNYWGNNVISTYSNTIYFRNSAEEMAAINPAWYAGSSAVIVYGNELVFEEIYKESMLKGYRLKSFQNLDTDVDFVLGDTYNGLPLLEIETNAFNYSTFKSFSIKHGEIVSDADRTGEITSTNESDCNHTINVKSCAFMGMFTEYIDIAVDITFCDDDENNPAYLEFEKKHSVDVFSWSEAQSITLPDNIEMIPRSMFSNCWNLKQILSTDETVETNCISPKITAIGSGAFAGCTALKNLHISNSVKTMGETVFERWGDGDSMQTIYFDDFYKAPIGEGYEEYTWSIDWTGSLYSKVEIEFKSCTVALDRQDGTGNIDNVSVLYGDPMPVAEMPEREGYKFIGYFSQPEKDGKQYYDENMLSAKNYDIVGDTTLYARWTPEMYLITFKYNEDILHECEVKYDDALPEIDFALPSGLMIMGFYTERDGNGIKYYDRNMNAVVEHYEVADDLELYVAPLVTKINYALNGGVNSEHNPDKINYGEKVVLEDPTQQGYNFIGWYLGGTEITELYNIQEEEITIIAVWEYIISFGFKLEEDCFIDALHHEYICISLPVSLAGLCRICVFPEVKQLRINGFKNQTYRMNIYIANRNTDFALILNNVWMVAGSSDGETVPAIAMSTDNNSKLNLYTKGSVIIKGIGGVKSFESIDGGCAIYCSTLCIYGTVRIYGGDSSYISGVVGSPSYNGKGGYAVIAEEDIVIPPRVYVYAYHGNGRNESPSDYPYWIKSGRDVITE